MRTPARGPSEWRARARRAYTRPSPNAPAAAISDATPVPNLPPMTFDEFPKWELGRRDRYEFVDGVVYAMSGGTRLHSRIALNVSAQLWTLAGDGPCATYAESRKLRIGDDLFYPDAIAICEPNGEDDRLAHRPCLLVEVLSPSSVRRDRGTKLAKYGALPFSLIYRGTTVPDRPPLRRVREEPAEEFAA